MLCFLIRLSSGLIILLLLPQLFISMVQNFHSTSLSSSMKSLLSCMHVEGMCKSHSYGVMAFSMDEFSDQSNDSELAGDCEKSGKNQHHNGKNSEKGGI